MIPVKVLTKDQRVMVPEGHMYGGNLTPHEINISQDFGVENRTRITVWLRDKDANLFSFVVSREHLLTSFEAAGIRLL